MEKIFIVQPGHYESISTVDSKVKNIIRIIGPSKKKEGFWVLDEQSLNGEKKEISESEIEQNYIALDTLSTLKKPKNQPGKIDIFAGFKPTSEKNSVNIKDTQQETIETIDIDTLTPPPVIKAKPVKIQQKPIEPNVSFDIEILEKVSIDYIDKQYIKKYSTCPPNHNNIVNIKLPIKLNYDIDKLRQTIELLDLDITEILNYIISKIDISVINEALYDILYDIIKFNKIPEIIKNTVVKEEIPISIVEEKIVEEKIEKQTKVIEKQDISSEISSIDDYIKNNIL